MKEWASQTFLYLVLCLKWFVSVTVHFLNMVSETENTDRFQPVEHWRECVKETQREREEERDGGREEGREERRERGREERGRERDRCKRVVYR